MVSAQEKEVLCTFYGFNIHKPEVNEACIFGAIIIMLCIGLNFRLPAPFAWSLIAIVSSGCAAFDVVPSEKPLRTLLIGLIAGAALAFVTTL